MRPDAERSSTYRNSA